MSATTPHSPLPPLMSATMETIDAKLSHAITLVELTARDVESLRDAHVRYERNVASMRGLALRLSAAGVAMATARAVQAVAMPSKTIAAMAAGAFAGGFLGTVLWQILHAHTAFAGLLPLLP